TNNKCSVFLQVDPAHAKVLVLEGRPTWDAKFFIQALHSDPIIEVDAIFKLSDKKFFAVSGTGDGGRVTDGVSDQSSVIGDQSEKPGEIQNPKSKIQNGPSPVTRRPSRSRGVMPTVEAKQVKIPSTAAELAKYDVVVIGKGYEEFFDEKSSAALKQYV